MKKIIATALSFILILWAFAGCGRDENNGMLDSSSAAEISNGSNKTLTMWNMTSEGYSEFDDKATFSKTIEIFSKDFPDVDFVVEDYEVPFGFNEGADFYKKLATACMAGTGPDVIYADPQFTTVNDLYKMQAAGAFADLTEFMENDKEFNKDDYVMPVIDGVKYDGKQYIMPLTYAMPVIYSPKETFEKEGFNAENFNNAEGILNEFIAFRERNPDNGKMLFTSDLFFSHFYRFMGLDVVDNINQKLNLDNELFKKTIEFYKINYKFESHDVKGYSPGMSILDYFPDKKVALCSNVINYEDYFLTLRSLSAIADQYVMLPWCNTEGGISVQLSSSIMINNRSVNKQNAWEFIKRALSAQEQLKPVSGYVPFVVDGIPINKKAWAPLFGKWIGELNFANVQMENSRPLKQSDLDYFIKLQEQISSVYIRHPNDREPYNLFVPYFEGEKTYDECKQEVRSLLEIYLSE